jgi:chorismate mutase
MDNRINEIRRKISALRTDMVEVEGGIRNQIKHDLDCTESALRLMAMRRELVALIGDWKAAGGGDRLPTVEVRLKETHRSPEKIDKLRALARR